MYLQQGKRGHRTSRELTRALNQAGKNPRDGDQDADDAEGKAGDTEAPKQPKFSTFCLRQSHLGQAVNTSEGKRGEKSAGLGTRRKHECLRRERELYHPAVHKSIPPAICAPQGRDLFHCLSTRELSLPHSSSGCSCSLEHTGSTASM